MSLDLPQLTDLLAADGLQSHLTRLFGHAGLSGVRVGLLHQERFHYAALETAGPEPADLVYPGCATKLFIGTMVRKAVSMRLFDLTTPAAALLGVPAASSHIALGNVTVRQLLEHTHGLDDSAVLVVPYRGNRIDHAELCAILDTPPLAAPGHFFSYGRAGAWLLTAILERQFDRPCLELLGEHLFAPLGIKLHLRAHPSFPHSQSFWCPAGGVALALSCEDLLKFLRQHLSGSEPHWIGCDVHALCCSTVALPGWSPLEAGCALGWKAYGRGWFGHNSTLAGSPMVIRVHPESGSAFFVATHGDAPLTIAGALFGAALPGFTSLQMPRLLRAAELQNLQAARYVGTYQNQQLRISIEQSRPHPLGLRMQSRTEAGPAGFECVTASLRAAQNDTFFLQPPSATILPFLQFVAPCDEGFQYLWNGTSLLAKAAAS